LASVTHGTNYLRRGRTVEKMGLRGLRVPEIRNLVTVGNIEHPEEVLTLAEDEL
jgi:hypothetical protein